MKIKKVNEMNEAWSMKEPYQRLLKRLEETESDIIKEKILVYLNLILDYNSLENTTFINKMNDILNEHN